MGQKKHNRKRAGNSTKEKIHRLLRDIEERMESEGGKASVTDYIRLLQLERELEESERPTEIKVTWVEPTEPHLIEK